MAIPKNINKEHLLNAIDKIDKDGIPTDGESTFYDVLYDGKRYPPKVIVSYANIFANGEELDRLTFRGGPNQKSFKLLEDNGFQIVPKMGNDMEYYQELKNFLTQAKNGELATSSYLKEYHGLKVKVSFGQGNQARVPWIAFLSEGQAVSHGIYPVYLYYKDKRLLILAYGISETELPSATWKLPSNTLSVSEYFDNNQLGKPERYGSSHVFKIYHTDKPLSPEEINEDLNEILSKYKAISTVTYTVVKEPKANLNNKRFEQKAFVNAAEEAHLSLPNNLITRFISSLVTKPFVILTGLSGSGKTKLAESFAKWICGGEEQYCIVPVGADWTNREPLLGYPNALNPEQYLKPENGVLDLMILANENNNLPYFLILDEMNLSHVERYFADFLSVMESSESIFLHSSQTPVSDVPSKLTLPKNLFIIGTVNIDETTYMFSPKVLDRASVIEFRISTESMESYLAEKRQLDLSSLISKGAGMAAGFVELAIDKNIEGDNISSTLMLFFEELKKVGAEFGYRSAAEINRFVAVAQTIKPDWSVNEIIDAAIMQKLLPKLHGSRRKLEVPLTVLGSLCLEDSISITDILKKQSHEIDFTDNANIKFPLSLEKILRMHSSLLSNGFTSYAEA